MNIMPGQAPGDFPVAGYYEVSNLYLHPKIRLVTFLPWRHVTHVLSLVSSNSAYAPNRRRFVHTEVVLTIACGRRCIIAGELRSICH